MYHIKLKEVREMRYFRESYKGHKGVYRDPLVGFYFSVNRKLTYFLRDS